MIALFATGDFIRVELRNPGVWGTRVGMLMGIETREKAMGTRIAIVVGEEGQLVFPPVTDIVINWRYDATKDAFRDLDAEDPGS